MGIGTLTLAFVVRLSLRTARSRRRRTRFGCCQATSRKSFSRRLPVSQRLAASSDSVPFDVHSPPCEKAWASGSSQLARRRLSARVVCAMPNLPPGTLDGDGHEPLVVLLAVPIVRSALA